MGMPSAVVRQTRLRHKIRSDGWPDPPQIPDTFVQKFPELKVFNDQMKTFVEHLRNATEPEGFETTAPTET